MAASQRDISVSEFFAKNRHLLGFDNPRKALLTTVKEAVDNALDACEEAGILPELWVHIERFEQDRYKVGVQDNGPGHPPEADPLDLRQAALRLEVPPHADEPRAAGHRHQRGRDVRPADHRQAGARSCRRSPSGRRPITTKSRSTPSATGRRSSTAAARARRSRRNDAGRRAIEKYGIEWIEIDHGTRVTIELEARYQRGRGSVDEYLEQTAIANPHVTIHYLDPDGGEWDHARVSDVLPPEPREIKPHPYGVELGMLVGMLKETKAPTVSQFLTHSFLAGQSGRGAEDLRGGQSEHAGQHAEVRPARGRSTVPGDPEDEDRRAGDRLHLAHRRGADPAGPAPGGAGRVLRRRHAAAGGLSRQSLRYRGGPGLRRRLDRAEGARGRPCTSCSKRATPRTLRQFLSTTFDGVGADAADKILARGGAAHAAFRRAN